MRLFGSLISLCLLLVLVSSYPVKAQGVTQIANISIEMTPNNPSPGQTVTLRAVSYSIDLSRSRLSWTYAGKSVLSGIGATQVSIIAPASGQTATANVTASASGISPLSSSVTLRPGSIDLLWEGAQSSVPPFYKGRPLFSNGGLLRVVAVPVTSAPNQLSYSWTRNDDALQNISGAGRSSIVVEHTIFNGNEKIGVSAAGGLFEGIASLSLTPRSPGVIAYKKDEGFIDFANGNEHNILSNDTGLIAVFEPLFFTLRNNNLSDLVFNFTIGGEPVYGERNELPFSRPEGNPSGSVNLRISTTQYSIQNVERLFNIAFE
ncbi:hypothetical protein IT401_02045 [Candidatus Nomurabacteria bacterium]|nr:hypothetical protein [Candidatus Nomurabacteria bacterium]